MLTIMYIMGVYSCISLYRNIYYTHDVIANATMNIATRGDLVDLKYISGHTQLCGGSRY